MRTIITTGDLRKALIDAIVDVRHGHLDVPRAQSIAKLASQVTESLYAELKVYKMQVDLGKEGSELNTLPLHNEPCDE